MAFYYQVPDTPEILQGKIEALKLEIAALELTLKKNRADLLKNHLLYDDRRIDTRKTTLYETESAIKSKNRKLTHLETVLKQRTHG